MTASRFTAAVGRHVRERGDAIFCHFLTDAGPIAIPWKELGARIGGFAAAYRARDLAPGRVVAILLRHDPALHPSYLAAMMSGLVPTFLPCPSPRQDPAIYWDAVRAALARLDCGAFVVARDTLDEMRAAGLDLDERRVILPDDVPAAGDLPPCDVDDAAIAFLQHSSGTTGGRKAVAISHRALAAQLDAYGKAVAVTRDDRIVSWLPLYHDMGLVACFLLPAFFGVPFVQLDPFRWVARPAAFLDAIADHRGTLAWLPNFAFAHLADTVRAAPRDLSSMRAFIDCSEPCRPKTLARFAGRFAAWGVRPEMLQACYAMAETVFAVTQTLLGAMPHASGGLLDLGPPVDGIAVSIRDRNGRPVPEGGFGEIALRGDFLCDGYVRDPARTADRFRGGWFHTRDRGRLVGGTLQVAGRLDDMLVVNGRKCHAHDIEAAIDALGLTKPGRCAAFTEADERIGGNALIVVAERRAPGDDDDVAAPIAERVRALFDMQPRDVRLVRAGWIVKTTSGKISRAGNARKYRARESAHV